MSIAHASVAFAAILIALIAGIYFGFAVVNGSQRDQLVEFNVASRRPERRVPNVGRRQRRLKSGTTATSHFARETVCRVTPPRKSSPIRE